MEEQGLAIVRTADTGAPVVAYQREVATGKVYAFASGGTRYAYGTAFANGSLYLYNLNAAATLNRCVEVPPATTCGSVYMGQVSAFGTGWGSLSGTGTFLATGKGGAAGKMVIWNVSTPGIPTPVLEIAASSPSVGLWKMGSSYYAARLDQTGKQLAVYNVSCIASGSCQGAPSPMWSGQVSATNSMQYITASVDGANAYLYLGAEDLGSCAVQREFIYDVTNPSSPSELTPKIHADGYWGWYYMGCPTGFNLVGPRQGKVYGNKLYRAAMSLLDSHKINKGGPPTANFAWTETEIYPGTAVHFQDQSSGAASNWSWVFTDGTPATASTPNPTVAFGSAGSKQVTLLVGNGQGEQSVPFSQAVTVLDPTPTLGSITVSPANPTVCQPVTLTSVDGKGAPTLNYDFAVLDSGAAQVAGNSGAAKSYVWSTGATTQAGTYTARLTLSNGAGSVTKSTIFTASSCPPTTRSCRGR
jgi:PKD repeat protein